MNLKTFIRQHRDDWNELDQTVKTIRKRRKSLTPERLDRFDVLYQKASHHLSYCQTYFPDEDVTAYLNDLVSRAHHVLYQDQVTSLNQLKQFFGHTFVRLLTEQWALIVVSFLLFMIGMTASFLSVLNDPLHLYAVLPDQIANAVDPERLGEGNAAIDSPAASASIMTNNIQVAVLAFAGGMTLGILTVYILIYNGIIIGALAALFWQHGKFYDFWAYIVPHGMIELTAIFIAGGAGLLMGYKILVPGTYPRRIQMKKQALRSVQLLLGTIPLFVLAGIIEGYITPAPISLEAKYVFACMTVIALTLYIWAGHRFQRTQTEGEATL